MFYLLLFLFGCAVGGMSGLLGIGGGIILVPGLMYLFGLTQYEAQGTSLAVMIPPVSIFAVILYYQYGHIQFPVVGWVTGGFVAGAWIGAKMLPYVPLPFLRVAFGLVLLYTGFMFVAAPVASRSAAALPAGLAALASAALGLLLRKTRRRRMPQPDEIEYHI